MRKAPTRTAALISRVRPLIDASAYVRGTFCPVIDPREQKPSIFPPEIPCIVATLPAGDISLFTFETRVALDRKAADDLARCLTSDEPRFERMLTKLSSYEFAAILIEASLAEIHRHDYRSQVSPAFLISKATSITMRHGVPVYFCGTHEHTTDLALRLLKSFWRNQGQVAA